MDELISKQIAIDAMEKQREELLKGLDKNSKVYGIISASTGIMICPVGQLSSAQPDNQVHLCDSCSYTYPECPSAYTDVIFGNGIGNDNICACSKYLPSAQPEQHTGKWIPSDSQCGIQCSVCGVPVDDFCHSIDYIDLDYKPNFCPNCGAKMEGW